MSVSMLDLQSAASDMGSSQGFQGPPIQISSEIGNVIEVTDLNDELGLNLLANQSKTNAPPQSFGSSPIRLSVPDEGAKAIQFDTLEPIDLGSFGGAAPMNSGGSGLPQVTVSRDNSSSFDNYQSSSSGPSISLTPAPPRDFEKEKQEKIEYLNKLQRLETKGYPVSKRFTMDNSAEEIKQEYTRLVDARNLEGSLRFQRQMLMGAITGLEWMNDKFDPFDIKLQGWSESVHTNVEDFDEIFEELYDKYKERGKMPPEMRLMMAVAGSGFMCHVSNSFFRQKMPSMDDVLKSNPMLAKQMAQAAAAQAGPGFGNFMGMAMGMPSPSNGAGFGGNQAPPNMPASAMAMDPPGSTGGFFGNNSRSPPNPSPLVQAATAAGANGSNAGSRREMKGPSGVDDILRTFEDVRRAEMETIGVRTMPNNSFVQSEQASQQQPAMVAVSELQSVASDDYSQADSTRSGINGRRGRGRRPAPVGASLSLDV
uniref:Uncharacterized protein n=1 Tax=viral metagenome TaxID=1070528 RepID=A0A6C0DJT0_9ZZZZ